MTYLFILLYLIAIVLANLSVTYFGPIISILNAFLFIGLDLTTRDLLHEKWNENRFVKMSLLILAGGLLSYILNNNAANIAIASSTSFLCAGLVDYLLYSKLSKFSKLLKINYSNIGSSLADSIVFPSIAFGFPPVLYIVAGQFLAKVFGGLIWSILFKNVIYGSTKQHTNKE